MPIVTIRALLNDKEKKEIADKLKDASERKVWCDEIIESRQYTDNEGLEEKKRIESIRTKLESIPVPNDTKNALIGLIFVKTRIITQAIIESAAKKIQDAPQTVDETSNIRDTLRSDAPSQACTEFMAADAKPVIEGKLWNEIRNAASQTHVGRSDLLNAVVSAVQAGVCEAANEMGDTKKLALNEIRKAAGVLSLVGGYFVVRDVLDLSPLNPDDKADLSKYVSNLLDEWRLRDISDCAPKDKEVQNTLKDLASTLFSFDEEFKEGELEKEVLIPEVSKESDKSVSKQQDSRQNIEQERADTALKWIASKNKSEN